MRRFKVTPMVISVVYPGIDHARFFPQKKADIQAFKKRSGIKNKYILFVGTFEPRKNLTTLIKAYVGLPDKLRSQYTLVLAGSRGWKNFLADRLLAKYEGEDIVDLGFVSDQDLPTVYSGASIFVFPSVFEGFGMPVIEAMACGTPVIAAKNSSLVEACGKAGLLFKTKDSADLRKKMTKVLSSANTRKSMRSKGIKHAKQFSWKNSAAELEKVFSKYE